MLLFCEYMSVIYRNLKPMQKQFFHQKKLPLCLDLYGSLKTLEEITG